MIVSLFSSSAARSHPKREQLGDPAQVGVFIGTVIQLLALIVALVAGVAATRQLYRTQTRARQPDRWRSSWWPPASRQGPRAQAVSLLAATRQVVHPKLDR